MMPAPNGDGRLFCIIEAAAHTAMSLPDREWRVDRDLGRTSVVLLASDSAGSA